MRAVAAPLIIACQYTDENFYHLVKIYKDCVDILPSFEDNCIDVYTLQLEENLNGIYVN